MDSSDISDLHSNSGSNKICAQVGCPSDIVDSQIMNEVINGLQKSGSSVLGFIPSRDIVTDNSTLVADEKTKVNFIPNKDNKHRDFVDEYIQRHDQRIRETDADNVSNKKILDNPMFIFMLASSIIFFIFDLPLFRNMCSKIFSLMSPTTATASASSLHLISLVKSILFGSTLFGVFSALAPR